MKEQQQKVNLKTGNLAMGWTKRWRRDRSRNKRSNMRKQQNMRKTKKAAERSRTKTRKQADR